MLSIGNIKIEQTASLSPMASVADRPYRILCKQFSACFLTSEMVPVNGIVHSKNLRDPLLSITESERPMAIQLFGSDPLYFKKAIQIVNSYNPDIIDINMGCPVKKVIKTGSGVALMLKVSLAQKIVDTAVNTANCPVTVKIRKGYDDENINAPYFARKMEQAGASAITVHGRTKSQLYSGKNDFSIIKQVKQNVSCAVIASGDIKTPMQVDQIYSKTGVDLVSIGRGSYGKPYIFEQISSYLKTGHFEQPTLIDRMKIMKKHVLSICDYYGEQNGIKNARGHISRYLFDIKGATKYRHKAQSLNSLEDFFYFFDELSKNLD